MAPEGGQLTSLRASSEANQHFSKNDWLAPAYNAIPTAERKEIKYEERAELFWGAQLT